MLRGLRISIIFSSSARHFPFVSFEIALAVLKQDTSFNMRNRINGGKAHDNFVIHGECFGSLYLDFYFERDFASTMSASERNRRKHETVDGFILKQLTSLDNFIINIYFVRGARFEKAMKKEKV